MGYRYIYRLPGSSLAKKKVLKYAAPYRPPRFAMRSRKTAAQLEGFLSPGSKVDMWTAERCLYTNERKPGSFLAAASLWKSQETFSALIMHWNVAQRELLYLNRMDRWPNDCMTSWLVVGSQVKAKRGIASAKR